jgi:hypothetical protein
MVTGLCTRNRNRVVEGGNGRFGRVEVPRGRFVSNERRLEEKVNCSSTNGLRSMRNRRLQHSCHYNDRRELLVTANGQGKSVGVVV